MEFRLAAITLDEKSVVQRSRAVEQEREIAIYDILEANVFRPEGSAGGHIGRVAALEPRRVPGQPGPGPAPKLLNSDHGPSPIMDRR